MLHKRKITTQRTSNLPTVQKRARIADKENVPLQSKTSNVPNLAKPSQTAAMNSEQSEQHTGPPGEWFFANRFFVYTPEEQRAREAFADDLFDDESPPMQDKDDPEMPGMTPQSDSDSDESDDNNYRSDCDCDSDQEDTMRSPTPPPLDSGSETAGARSPAVVTECPSAEQLSSMTEPLLRESGVLPAGHHGDTKAAPNLPDARDAHTTISAILKPKRVGGKGYVSPKLDLVLQTRLEWIKIFLWIYIDVSNNLTRREGPRWIAASLRAASTAQKGPWFARLLREWTRSFIIDHAVLPENKYGGFKTSMLSNEDLAQEIVLHLQSIGKWVRAMDIVHYLDLPDVKSRYKLKKTISLATAQCWMVLLIGS
ncbi:hypothetical protein HWV62_17022 [Athelia sp. TMB]|nr:hypothetical protein HWV62_17022 [Athelia sp. TMB]